jgi:hypothetical protein
MKAIETNDWVVPYHIQDLVKDTVQLNKIESRARQMVERRKAQHNFKSVQGVQLIFKDKKYQERNGRYLEIHKSLQNKWIQILQFIDYRNGSRTRNGQLIRGIPKRYQ